MCAIAQIDAATDSYPEDWNKWPDGLAQRLQKERVPNKTVMLTLQLSATDSAAAQVNIRMPNLSASHQPADGSDADAGTEIALWAKAAQR